MDEVIQCIFQGLIDVASEKYHIILQELTEPMKNEISSYVHQHDDKTFAEYSFPSYPPLPTVQEQRLVVVPGASE
jgi:hypothetical protein